MRISARKCPWTQKLFDNDQKYTVHLTNLRKEQRAKRDIKHSIAAVDRLIDWAANNVRTTTEFEDWFRTNWDQFVLRAHAVYRQRWGSTYLNRKSPKTIQPIKLISVSMKQLTGDIAFPSNSHDCPKNGVRNWHRDPTLPLSYPGWRFRLSFSYEGNFPSFVSDMFEDTIVNFGSGGGGPKDYGSEVTLWADDWPAMREFKEKQIVWTELNS